MDYPKTRAEAKATGAKYYFTGEPCKHGHVAPRKTKGACVECVRIEWKTTLEKRKDYFTSYNQSNKGKDNKRAWYERNRETVIERAKSQNTGNKRKYRAKWRQHNKLKHQLNCNVRRRRHREATPKWLTHEQKQQIKAIYASAIQLTQTTGTQYVVDHIVPLRGDTVCGLHVPWNLQVMTQEQNLLKSNKVSA